MVVVIQTVNSETFKYHQFTKCIKKQKLLNAFKQTLEVTIQETRFAGHIKHDQHNTAFPFFFYSAEVDGGWKVQWCLSSKSASPPIALTAVEPGWPLLPSTTAPPHNAHFITLIDI